MSVHTHKKLPLRTGLGSTKLGWQLESPTRNLHYLFFFLTDHQRAQNWWIYHISNFFFLVQKMHAGVEEAIIIPSPPWLSAESFLEPWNCVLPHVGKTRHVGELTPLEQVSVNRSWDISFLAGWVKMLGDLHHSSLRAPARGVATCPQHLLSLASLPFLTHSPLLLPMFLGSLTKQFAIEYLPQGPLRNPSQRQKTTIQKVDKNMDSRVKYLGSSLCFYYSSCVILGNIFIFFFVKFSCACSIEKCDYPIE